MSWTDERVETLKKMWAEGQSASQIAKELGGVTRNAVIGKVHRLGLSNRVVGAAACRTPGGGPGGPGTGAHRRDARCRTSRETTVCGRTGRQQCDTLALAQGHRSGRTAAAAATLGQRDQPGSAGFGS